MRITALETLRPVAQPNLLFVLLHTDTGRTGLGEAFFGARTVEAYLHETVAGTIVGMDNPTPERVAQALRSYVGYQGAGAETRGNGAIDLAVWDLLGQVSGLPLASLLGGPIRDTIPIYNTCAGSDYVRHSTRQESGNWGLPPEDGSARRYEDLRAFLEQPGELARELWDEGIRGMKVWPFDRAAEATAGTAVSHAELTRGLAVIEAIRESVGMEMNLMVELHGLWSRPAATRILEALTPYRPQWVEDPLRPDAVDALSLLARDVDVAIATGETCVGRRGFAALLGEGAMDVATVDVTWTGGLTEARKVASLADTYTVPVAPHDCGGPVSLAASVHLVLSQPNGLVQETVRAFYRGWYQDLVTGLPPIQGGQIGITAAPGHGVALREDLTGRDDVVRAVSGR